MHRGRNEKKDQGQGKRQRQRYGLHCVAGVRLNAGCRREDYCIEDLIGSYRGPWVNFDFGRDGMLIGIEIIVTGGPGSATQS